jgi:hypothetical protein
MVPETLVDFNELTWLMAREDFIIVSRCEVIILHIKNILSFHLLSRSIDISISKSIVLPVILYGDLCWMELVQWPILDTAQFKAVVLLNNIQMYEVSPIGEVHGNCRVACTPE